MSDGRLGREAAVAGVSGNAVDAAARAARLAGVVGHHYPEDQTVGRLGRIAIVVAISRPHGWDLFDDPAL